MARCRLLVVLAAASGAVRTTTANPVAPPRGNLTMADIARARQPRPLPTSHVVGSNAGNIFAAMNLHLLGQPVPTRPCEEHNLDELNSIGRVMWSRRSERLAAIYSVASDNRQLHFDGLEYKEQLWRAEKQLAAEDPARYGAGTTHHAMVRQGKCAELVMWWVHHLPAAARAELSALEGFSVPLLPADDGALATRLHAERGAATPGGDAPVRGRRHVDEYIYQVSCSDCHSSGGITAPGPTALRPRTAAAGDPAPGTCPTTAAGTPTVWYEPMANVGHRKKRCDWDYDPPCQLCEGIGGWAWGDQENEISYTDCTPVANASDIPADNRTSPVWPKSFVVDEITTLINQLPAGQFPGADPCAGHKFANDTEVLWFDDSRVNFEGPIMYTDTSKSDIWTLPTADMFIKIEAFGVGVFCICVSPHENANHSAAPIGPLVYDFAKDAVLVGRERIGLEGLNTSVVADHWNKGPHHFWFDIQTNLMVRGWQPWNGLNIYKPGTWRIGPVHPKSFAVDKSCYTGLLHKNISCVAPYPPA